MPPKKKNPVLAAVLALLLGPVGYLYVGWRFAIVAFGILATFVVVLMVVGFNPADFPAIRSWIRYPFLAALSWRAYRMTVLRNDLIEAQDPKAMSPLTLPIATMFMAELLVELAIVYALSLGLFTTYLLFRQGSVLGGCLMLFLATPGCVYLASLLFSFVSMAFQFTIMSLSKTAQKLFS